MRAGRTQAPRAVTGLLFRELTRTGRPRRLGADIMLAHCHEPGSLQPHSISCRCLCCRAVWERHWHICTPPRSWCRVSPHGTQKEWKWADLRHWSLRGSPAWGRICTTGGLRTSCAKLLTQRRTSESSEPWSPDAPLFIKDASRCVQFCPVGCE